jgi:uncharacterized protein involved in exopolysaccharide biosynthesis
MIDLQVLVDRLIRNYALYIGCVVVCLALGIALYKLLPPRYEVVATLQLKDQSLTSKGTAKEKFIVGLELFEGNSELEDEIGILSSFSLIRDAVDELNLDVSCFRYGADLGPLGRNMEEEIYQEDLYIEVDHSHPAIINQPVYLDFASEKAFRVTTDATEASLCDLRTGQILRNKLNVKLDTLGRVGRWLTTPYFSIYLTWDSLFMRDPQTKYFFVIQSREALAKDYHKRLKIAPISKESNIVELKLQGRAAKKEIDFLNALARVYIENDMAKKSELGMQTISFIDSQLALVYDSLTLAEGNLKSFRTDNQIIDISTTAQNLQQQLTELEKERAELQVQHDFFQYTVRYLHENNTSADVVAPSSVGIHDPFLNNLLVQLSELYREKIDKSFSSKPGSPVTQLIDSKINNTRAAILDNINGLVNSNRIGLRENTQRMAALNRRIEQLPESERSLLSINRKFALNDNIYNYLLEKRAEAGIALASNHADKAVIDPARQNSSRPVFPDLRLILFGSLALGLFIPTGFILITDMLDKSVRGETQAIELTHLPVIGLVPRHSRGEISNPLIHNNQPRHLLESFRFITKALGRLYGSEKSQVLGITSPQARDGKTYVSMHIALTYAITGNKTLYLDLDLARNVKVKSPGDEVTTVYEYLSGTKENLPTILGTTSPNLFVMEGGHAPGHTFPLDKNEKLACLFEYVNKNFEKIIVDTPPLTLLADYHSVASFVNVHLLVVRQGKTSQQLTREASKSLLPPLQAGIILNAVEKSRSRMKHLARYYM